VSDTPPELPPIPHAWSPRPYQADVFAAYDRGIKRFDLPWHRRAGKDSTGMNFTAKRMKAEPGAYWHLFPKLVQAKRAIWNGLDPETGVPFLDQCFPEPWRVAKNDNELFLRVHEGSTWQMAGSDSYDRLVGANVRGVVLSEWSLCDPMAWEFIRPILAENGGWAMFIYTFRGKNHAYQQHQKLKGNPDWYIKRLTVNDTTRADGTPVVTPEAIDKERRDGMSEPLIQQEFFCNPIAARPGAVYGATMSALVEQQRTRVGYDPTLPVIAAWNLEHMPAAAAVVFVQELGNELAIIGSRSWMFTPISQCLAELESGPHKFPWKAARHVLRIDGEQVWPDLFDRYGLETTQTREHSSAGKAAAVTAAMLERTTIDTTPRPWLEPAESSNNELLVDSLNGYRMKELERADGGGENFSDAPLVSYERYAAGAVELFAAWHWAKRGARRRPIDYSAQDRAVI
jgi:hypothetical protein